MLVKLLPAQTPEFWPILELGLRKTLPASETSGPTFWTDLLDSLMGGSTACWVFYQESDNTPVGFVLTQITGRIVSGYNDLLIYAVYGWIEVPPKAWVDGYHTLSQYAKAAGCKKITAFTDVPQILGLAKTFGAKTRNYIELELEV